MKVVISLNVYIKNINIFNIYNKYILVIEEILVMNAFYLIPIRC